MLMKSQIQRNIIDNENLFHNCKIEAKKLYDIAQNMNISIQKISNIFQLKVGARHKVNQQKGRVKVKLYTECELQEIKKQIKQEFKDYEKINHSIIKKICQKYKIGDEEIRTLFHISYNQLTKLKREKEYSIKNTLGKEITIKEITQKYRYKAYINLKDIQEIKKIYQFNTKQVAQLFQLPIEKIRNLENYQTNRIRIHLYTKKDIEKIIQNSQKVIQKQKCTFVQLEKILENQPYDKEIVLEILGVNKTQYEYLKNNKIKTISVSNYETKQKVDLFLFDIENLYKYGKRAYSVEELENILDYYELKLEEFIEYSDKKEIVRKMYKDSILYNRKIQINQKTRMTNEFFENNYEIIEKKIRRKVTEFCITYRCYQEKEDYLQASYEFLLSEGGYITENMMHDVEKAIKLLCGRVKANLIKQYYERPLEFRIDINYQGREIAEDQNKNFIDTRFSPEKILETEEKITELHRIILRNILGNFDFVSDSPQDFFQLLAYQLEIDDAELDKLKEKIGLIILQNNLARLDKKGRIIQMNG